MQKQEQLNIYFAGNTISIVIPTDKREFYETKIIEGLENGPTSLVELPTVRFYLNHFIGFGYVPYINYSEQLLNTVKQTTNLVKNEFEEHQKGEEWKNNKDEDEDLAL